MAKLSSTTDSAYKRVLLFGPPKSGKTELAGRLAEKFNVILVDMENGASTLRKLPREWQERIEVISLPDTRSYPIAIETALKMVKGVPGKVCEAHGKWECAICSKDSAPFVQVDFPSLGPGTVVIFDSLTQLTNSAISFITKSQPDEYKLDYDDYGYLGKLLDIFLSHIQQAKFHVVCITHETEVQMEDGKNKLVPTSGTRSASRNTAKYFDEVYYCELKNRKHVVGSASTYSGNILTGSRAGNFMETLEVPSLIPVFQGLTGISAKPGSPENKAASSLGSLRASLLSPSKK